MRRSGKLLIILGVLLAIISFGGIWWMMNVSREPVDTQVEITTQPVVVAAVKIPARTRITPDMITVKQMPVDMVSPMAISSIPSASDQIALTDIYGDQIILHTMLADPIAHSSLIPALNVPMGMVAVALPLNEVSGVGEALRVGDHVDVIVSLNTFEYDAEGNESLLEYSAQLTVQRVKVLHLGAWLPPMPDQMEEGVASSGLMSSAGRTGGSTCEPLNVAVVLVEPQDALVLKYAVDNGVGESRFILALRGIEDEDQYTTEAVNQEYMIQRFKFARPPFIIREPGQ